MDKLAFKLRMQNLKSYRENNPGKGYWDWKVQAYLDGGENNNPWPNISELDRQYLYDKINPSLGFGIFDFLGAALTYSNIANRAKAPDEDENRWKAYLGLPYDKEYAPDTKIRFNGDENYPNRQYQGLSKDAKDEIRSFLPLIRQTSKSLPEGKWIQVTDKKQGSVRRSDVIEHTRQNHLGDLGKFGIRENNESGIYEIGDKYDFPWYVPVPDRAKGTELMIRDTIWSDRANPEKYVPYKVPAHANGGEVNEFQRKTRRDIMQESLVDGRPNYDKMFLNQNEYQKDFANYWYTERAKNPKYSDQIGGDKLNTVLSNVSRATWKTPTEAMRDNMVGLGYNPTDAQINQLLNILKEKGTKGFANPKAYSYTSLRPTNTWHEGVGHMVGDNTPSILNANPNIYIQDANSEYLDYVNQANEKHALTWDFRGNNSNLKDDQGNYYIDPNRLLTPEDIKDMRSKGAKIPELWESLEDADISELTNTFAYNLSLDPILYMATGGEVGNTDDEFAKAVNTKLGRTPDGRPLQLGLKPVFDLEDAANMTPVGDVITTKDIYNSVKESDWSSAGLAALTLLPFVPSGIRNIKAATRYVPSVNKGLDQRMLDNAFNSIKEKREYLSDVANERNRVLESVNDYAHRVRAQKADQMFGTNYNETYDLLSDLYEHRFFDLPEVLAKDMPQIGKMEAKASAKTRYGDTGIGAGPSDFDFLVNADRPIDAKEIARHEMNHYTDYLISRNPNTTTNNNMLKQLESSLKNTDEKEYFRSGTEQKAYMNLLRARMYEDGAISSLDELVTPSTIKSYIDKLGDKDSIKRAYKQHKSLSSYTKWFNSIPLLGIGAIGANNYFNNNETKQEK